MCEVCEARAQKALAVSQEVLASADAIFKREGVEASVVLIADTGDGLSVVSNCGDQTKSYELAAQGAMFLLNFSSPGEGDVVH